MFLMCVCAKLDMGYLRELYRYNLTDANAKPSSRPGCTDTKQWAEFWKTGWIFQPTQLHNYSFETVAPRHIPLPITYDQEPGADIGSGSSAIIFRAQFLEQYCDIPQLGKGWNDPTLTEFCALKRYERTTTARDCADRKWAFAAWLASYPQLRDDPHITKTFLGFW